MKNHYSVLAVFSLFLATTLNSQSLLNGDMESWPPNCPFNVAPNSWTNFSTSLGPDQAGCVGPVVSYQGNSHMNLVWSTMPLREGAEQMVTGLNPGDTYQINFYAIHDQGLWASTGSVFLDVYVNSVVIFSTPELFNLGPWTGYSAGFTATASTALIGFRVRDGLTGSSGSVGVDAISIDLSTATNHTNDPSTFIVFPNPVENELNITCPPDAELTGVSLYSVCGQVVYGAIPSVSGDLVKLDLSALAPGVYFLEMMTGVGVLVRKVVVR